MIIDLPDKYNEVRNIINNLILIDKFSSKLNLSFDNKFNDISIISYIINNNSIYLQDLIYSFSATFIKNKREQYEYIYDNVCSYLDNKFKENNYCDFKNNQCIENRQSRSPHHSMGCCYSFDYAGLFDPGFTKNVQLCEHLNCKTCSTKCISCKIFTCKYLRDKGVHFYTNELLLLDCFFNNKQKLILKYNFFKTRDQIINKLLEKTHSSFCIYYLFNKYKII